MKRILMIAVAAAMIGGCMTAQMKSTPFYEGHDVTYTGKAEDRVNLWPLAYWREPVGSVVWPLVSWGDDHFALRPVYSRYGKERNFLWPIGQHDSATGDGRAFPVFWGKDRFNVFPLVWNNNKFHSLFPLFFWREDDYMTLFPLAWWDIDGERFTLFPLYGHSKEADWLFPIYWRDDDMIWVTLLFGMNKHGDSWLIPFYASVSGDFVSPLWCGGGSSSDENYWWCVPPLLSSYESWTYGKSKTRLLLGIYGHDTATNGTAEADWLFPLYSWQSGSSGKILFGLAGWEKDGTNWVFPLYGYDGDAGDFTTALFGRATHSGHTDWWWLTPLAGHTTGNESGFWLWPLVSWSRGDDFASLEKMMNAETLAPFITGEMKSEVRWNCKTAKPVTNEVFLTEGASAASKLRFGSGLFGSTRNISHGGGDNDYISDWRWSARTAASGYNIRRSDNDYISDWRWSAVKRAAGDEWRTGKERTVTFNDKTAFGNSITFGGEKTRVVNFDYDMKEKVFDGELDESCSLFGLLWSSRDEKIAGGHRYKKRALLWRFWHWEELNGDVSLDVFPGFTYDSKTNGYSKTSFLWRFFRYENDPAKGEKVDLLFIPVWR